MKATDLTPNQLHQTIKSAIDDSLLYDLISKIFWGAVIYLIIHAITIYFVNKSLPKDSTDSTDSINSRSGMNILIDNKTKCEYLSTRAGSLTPRLSANGIQLGCI